MKIVKRFYGMPIQTMNIWFIPTLAYLWQKSLGSIRPDKEWMWLAIIPAMIVLWFIFNFKIVKK